MVNLHSLLPWKEDKNTKPFRPWWKKIAGYSVLILILISGIAFGVGMSKGNLVCTLHNQAPQNASNITETKTVSKSLSTSDYNFINEACIQSLGFWSRWFHFVLLATSVVLIILHALWYLLPGIESKMERFLGLIDDVKTSKWTEQSIGKILLSDTGLDKDYNAVSTLQSTAYGFRNSLESKTHPGLLNSYFGITSAELIVSAVCVVVNISLFPNFERNLTCDLSSNNIDLSPSVLQFVGVTFACKNSLAELFTGVSIVYIIFFSIYFLFVIWDFIWIIMYRWNKDGFTVERMQRSALDRLLVSKLSHGLMHGTDSFEAKSI